VTAYQDRLQGHEPVESGLACLVDDAHAASPRFCEDLLAGKVGPGGRPLNRCLRWRR
jgi:hypothetical protein